MTPEMIDGRNAIFWLIIVLGIGFANAMYWAMSARSARLQKSQKAQAAKAKAA